MARRHRILDVDLADDPLASNRRSLVVTNLVFVGLGVILPALGIVMLAAGLDPLLGIALVGVGLARFASVYLNLHQRGGAAIILGIGTGALVFVALGIDFGAGIGLDTWSVIFVAVPPLIMARQHDRLRPLVIGITLGTVVATQIIVRVFPPRILLSPATTEVVRTVILVLAIVYSTLVLRLYRRMLDRGEERIIAERQVSERLLANILPGPIAARLKRDEYPIADGFDSVSVLFADVVSFTEFAAHEAPAAVVELLNRLFYAFDDMVERRGLEKIKTIGDAYMVAAGVPDHRNDHAAAIAELAFEMLAFVASLPPEHGRAVELRIGIHTGPLVAGIIGKRKFAYDVWGDTVNTAARLQSTSEPGRIQISEATARALGPAWRIEPRGTIALKGLGEMPTYFLAGRAG